MQENPFIVKGYKSPAYFCDRDDYNGAVVVRTLTAFRETKFN